MFLDAPQWTRPSWLAKSKQTGSGLRVPRAFPVVMAFILPRSDASFIMGLLSGSNSVVECDLAKVEVAGSNPVSRSIDSVPGALCWRALCMFGSAAGHRWTFLASGATLISGRGTQVVRERSAKPLCVGSIPTRASIDIFFIFKLLIPTSLIL